MKNDLEQFIEEGMKRYKEASSVLVKFGKEIESRLQNILETREDWGKFIPEKEAYARSTKYWSEYPLLNARIEGRINDEKVMVIININWYESDSSYPFYFVELYPLNKLLSEVLNQFSWEAPYQFTDNKLLFYPRPKDFNLERDFNKLLDEILRLLKSIQH